MNVLLDEVGLKGSENVGVGGPTQQFCYQALAAYLTSHHAHLSRLVISESQYVKPAS